MKALDKRGTADVMVIWIPRIIMTTVVIFTIVFLLRSFVRTSIDVFDTETSVFAHRLLYLQSLNYVDSEGRIHPGMIDLSKYSQEKISEAMGQEIFYGKDNRYIAAKISLKNLDDGSKTYREIYYNPVLYERAGRIYHAGLTQGAGGVRGVKKAFYVLISDNEKIQKGVLDVEVIFPNS
ncbi:hypothetical protein HY638_00225 [Candidatus Woesearchaeota archaeon]|nr:hypothetical protein [Candidatus Woesearchaeota archaeon]